MTKAVKDPLLIGFANSTFQASGEVCGPSNWTEAARSGTVPQSGESISHWHHFEADLDKMAEIGVNSYRFTIEWSHAEPKCGYFDEEVLSRYEKILENCHARGIQPMVTLYHFTEPHWFSLLGSFEKEENICHFINFCEVIYKRFKRYVKLWCTINEPAVHAFSGYFWGQFPPHQHSLQKTITFLKNLLKAHVLVYRHLKQIGKKDETEIGIVHNVLRFVPRYEWEWVESWFTRFLTVITNDLVINFFKTGKFDYYFPLLASENYYADVAPYSFDFMGLNFYANVVFGINAKTIFGPTSFPHQEVGTMYCAIDPQGFDHAIELVSTLGKPLYITETGIADHSDILREKFLQQYLAVIEKKRSESFDIRGLYLWTFADNYEWDQGFSQQFGFFDHQRVKRKSTATFEAFITRMLSVKGE